MVMMVVISVKMSYHSTDQCNGSTVFSIHRGIHALLFDIFIISDTIRLFNLGKFNIAVYWIVCHLFVTCNYENSI